MLNIKKIKHFEKELYYRKLFKIQNNLNVEYVKLLNIFNKMWQLSNYSLALATGNFSQNVWEHVKATQTDFFLTKSPWCGGGEGKQEADVKG